MLVSLSLGSAVATSFLGIYGDLSRRMALELRSYGANILVEPLAAEQGGELNEADLPRIKTVFWRYNIVGFAPYLFGAVNLQSGARQEQGVITGTWFARPLAVEGEESAPQGVKVIAPWWSVEGGWPGQPAEAIAGAALARRLGLKVGSEVTATSGERSLRLRVCGIVTTGGYEEEQIFAPLQTVQAFLGREGKVSRVLVSALTVPMDDFGRRNPATMSKQEYERWYCTAYVTAVAKNVEEAMAGSRARPIWQIASAEGPLLKKLNLLILLLTVLALAAAATAVSSSLMASMAERGREIALMKAIGADRRQIAAIFLGETFLVALLAGLAGYVLGAWLGGVVSRTVFTEVAATPRWLLPLALLSSLGVAFLGSLFPLRRAMAIEPVRLLRG
ncbi:MAG TPA: ABC transporter permease [Geobacteraceae bacterium]